MSDVKAIIEINTPPVVQRKKSKGKQPLPVERRRVILSVRVMPSTMEYLKSMGYASGGRALDVLVKSVQHGGIREMLTSKANFSIVNLAG